MSIPYRKAPRGEEEGAAAFLDLAWLPALRTFYAGLLLVDSRGRPLEFVHNSLVAPAGFLWPASQVQRHGVAGLVHSLFEACRLEPDLLVCPEELGDSDFCRTELSPSLPFARVGAADPARWTWVNDPPTPSMRAHRLARALQQRGLATEPLERVRAGLRELYPEAPWDRPA